MTKNETLLTVLEILNDEGRKDRWLCLNGDEFFTCSLVGIESPPSVLLPIYFPNVASIDDAELIVEDMMVWAKNLQPWGIRVKFVSPPSV